MLAWVLCGRPRFGSSCHPGPLPSVISSMSESRSRAMLPGLPPEQANTARLNSPSRLTSCSRHERIGPTKSASRLCHTVAKRVGPAPQASKTMSASFSPVCGRAPGSLDTLTINATRSSRAGSSSGSPVSGWTGGGSVVVGAAVVVVTSSVVVVAGSVVVVAGSVVVVGGSVVVVGGGGRLGGLLATRAQ